MRPIPRAARLCVAAGCFVAPALGADLFEGFAAGWRERWSLESWFGQPTHYAVVADSGRLALHAASRGSHAGLMRKFEVANPTSARLAWRWKVAAPLVGNTRERERAGDDYAARVFVVFETSLIPLRTRALNYVWAAHVPEGTIFPSPYTNNVAMIVVRSGPAAAGQWHAESRDVIADYRRHFGEPPTKISAVAVLVDTDNTKSSADAWFADLSLETQPAPVADQKP